MGDLGNKTCAQVEVDAIVLGFVNTSQLLLERPSMFLLTALPQNPIDRRDVLMRESLLYRTPTNKK